MKILIIEDEQPAAKRLEKLIRELRPDVEVLAVIESVEKAVAWFSAFPPPDLIFMDIQLADGISFELFGLAQVQSPVIFTTAYDQYTLRAFKVNSVDYLLKPVDPEELSAALAKYQALFQRPVIYDRNAIEQLIRSVAQPSYKERFLIRSGQQIGYIPIADIRYFFSDEGLVFARTTEGKKHIIDFTLDQVADLVRPTDFFRINRKIVAHILAVRKISPYFNSRLILELQPKPEFDVIVSRDRVNEFKQWLDR